MKVALQGAAAWRGHACFARDSPVAAVDLLVRDARW